MIDVLRTSAAALALALAGTAFAADDHHSLAQGDAKAGADKAATCVACHGPDGNSVNPEWPKIAGQSARYLEGSLAAYKSGDRKNALMAGQAMNLSEQDMKDLAAHYAAQTMTPGAGSESSIEVAARLAGLSGLPRPGGWRQRSSRLAGDWWAACNLPGHRAQGLPQRGTERLGQRSDDDRRGAGPDGRRDRGARWLHRRAPVNPIG